MFKTQRIVEKLRTTKIYIYFFKYIKFYVLSGKFIISLLYYLILIYLLLREKNTF